MRDPGISALATSAAGQFHVVQAFEHETIRPCGSGWLPQVVTLAARVGLPAAASIEAILGSSSSPVLRVHVGSGGEDPRIGY